jgi:hypothetical protein
VEDVGGRDLEDVRVLTMANSINEVGRRWEYGVPHDLRAVKMAKALALIDRDRGGDYFDFRFGGDGDNGEELTFLLDVYFADLDQEAGD